MSKPVKDFEDVYHYATIFANSAFADVKTKEKIRENIINLIAHCCIEYVRNETFRNEMNRYIKNNMME